MTGKEQLWYLINGILEGAYDVETFCDEFTRIYDLEIDYETLSKTEKKEFGDLSEMTARFSNDDEELKIDIANAISKGKLGIKGEDYSKD